MQVDADILMITYNRPEYTRLSLPTLLDSCPPCSRVWIWHNGEHAETWKAVEQFSGHSRLAEVRYSPENKFLREPTNWFWERAKGRFVGKVDDDCLVPVDWLERLARIHDDVDLAGVLSCWPYLPQDYREELAKKKTVEWPGNHRVMLNCWVGGSGYLMKRQSVGENGLLRERESFSSWCLRLAARGYKNGFPLPLLYMDHMDDPLSPNTLIKNEKDFRENPTLSSLRFGTPSYDEYCRRARRSPVEIQEASPAVWLYTGWTGKLMNRVRLFRSPEKKVRLDP